MIVRVENIDTNNRYQAVSSSFVREENLYRVERKKQRRKMRFTKSAALVDMKRPGVVLLLLTSAAAVEYHWQAAVSLPGPAVQTTSAVSAIHCGLRCEVLPSECSGFIYEVDDDSCRLFSCDCRGPAADSSQQTTDRYMGRSKCPGKNRFVLCVIPQAQ